MKYTHSREEYTNGQMSAMYQQYDDGEKFARETQQDVI